MQFSRNGIESRDHLFFECSFSSRIWKAGLHRCIVDNHPLGWDDVIREGCRNWKSKAMYDVLCKLVLRSTVYHLWRARNEIQHSGIPNTEDQILKVIIWEVRSRILGKGRFNKSLENFRLCQNWNLSVKLLV